MQENVGWRVGDRPTEASEALARQRGLEAIKVKRQQGGRTTGWKRAPAQGGERRLYEDGCEKADKELGHVSSCFECPFEECRYEPKCYLKGNRRPRVAIVDGFPILNGTGGIRPRLTAKDLDLILRALRDYSRVYPDEKEACLVFLHRILRKRVCFSGKWYKKDWDSSSKFAHFL